MVDVIYLKIEDNPIMNRGNKRCDEMLTHFIRVTIFPAILGWGQHQITRQAGDFTNGSITNKFYVSTVFAHVGNGQHQWKLKTRVDFNRP